MVAALQENGLGQVIDLVPNHMGVGGADNSWWLNVLEWVSGMAAAHRGAWRRYDRSHAWSPFAWTPKPHQQT
jgi:maltooligosyltrehalose synthase